MSRFARRVDRNHAEIVATFRALGCSVLSLASVGAGVPDLLVCCGDMNFLVEVKDGAKPPSARQLTPAQKKFRASWPAPVYVVLCREDVVELVAAWRAK